MGKDLTPEQQAAVDAYVERIRSGGGPDVSSLERVGVQIHEKAVVKKFDGVPPEHEHDPTAFGHKPFETVVAEDGKPTQVIRGDADAEES